MSAVTPLWTGGGSAWSEPSEISWVREDSFDLEASRQVQRLFEDVDVVLFGEDAQASRTIHLPPQLSAECKQWSSMFTHMRPVAVQVLAEADTAVAQTTGPAVDSRRSAVAPADESSTEPEDEGGLSVRGSPCVIVVQPSTEGEAAYDEEIFAVHGKYEEYFAFDGYEGALPTLPEADDVVGAETGAETGTSLCADQVADVLWSQLIPALLPLAERLAAVVTDSMKERSSSTDSSIADSGSLYHNMGPLSQGLLDNLSQTPLETVQIEDDASGSLSLSRRVASAVHTGSSPGRPPLAFVPTAARSPRKLEGLSSAITIRGLPLQKRVQPLVGRPGSALTRASRVGSARPMSGVRRVGSAITRRPLSHMKVSEPSGAMLNPYPVASMNDRPTSSSTRLPSSNSRVQGRAGALGGVVLIGAAAGGGLSRDRRLSTPSQHLRTTLHSALGSRGIVDPRRGDRTQVMSARGDGDRRQVLPPITLPSGYNRGLDSGRGGRAQGARRAMVSGSSLSSRQQKDHARLLSRSDGASALVTKLDSRGW